ncbi:MAG: hypothetical protein ACI83P_001450 [Janthinobacterium sp.]|jgi:hypothetical protein
MRWRYVILDGILKRVVTHAQAGKMILRFSSEHDIETCYGPWCLTMPAQTASSARSGRAMSNR